jgi:hypothetical protein
MSSQNAKPNACAGMAKANVQSAATMAADARMLNSLSCLFRFLPPWPALQATAGVERPQSFGSKRVGAENLVDIALPRLLGGAGADALEQPY